MPVMWPLRAKLGEPHKLRMLMSIHRANQMKKWKHVRRGVTEWQRMEPWSTSHRRLIRWIRSSMKPRWKRAPP
eukprot:7580763-Alexandrium_andersonii.AAC.1